MCVFVMYELSMRIVMWYVSTVILYTSIIVFMVTFIHNAIMYSKVNICKVEKCMLMQKVG